jgi:hypothetical protein
MHRLCPQTVIVIAILSFVVPLESSAQQARLEPMAWDTCTFIEGKGHRCVIGEKPRKFEDYLNTEWVRQPVDGFSVNSGLDRIPQNQSGFKANWREIGVLRTTRIREVRYFLNDVPVCVKVLLAERKDGLFAPLLKWCGDLPEPVLYRVADRPFSLSPGTLAGTFQWFRRGRGRRP